MNEGKKITIKKVVKEIIDWVLVVVIAYSVSLTIGLTNVIGFSMYPTLTDGDYLLMEKVSLFFNKIDRTDVITFKAHIDGEDKYLIKRVIGVEGDQIKVQNGNVYLNNKILKEAYLPKNLKTVGDVDIFIPHDKLFVMGDNRDNSSDSRFNAVGLVDEESVVGIELFKIVNFKNRHL